MKTKRIISHVTPEDRYNLQEGCDEKDSLSYITNSWDWLIFVAGFCAGIIISLTLFINN